MEVVEIETKSNPSVKFILHIYVEIFIETKEISPKTKDTLINRMLG